MATLEQIGPKASGGNRLIDNNLALLASQSNKYLARQADYAEGPPLEQRIMLPKSIAKEMYYQNNGQSSYYHDQAQHYVASLRMRGNQSPDVTAGTQPQTIFFNKRRTLNPDGQAMTVNQRTKSIASPGLRQSNTLDTQDLRKSQGGFTIKTNN